MPHDAIARPLTPFRSPWAPAITLLAGLGLAAGIARPADAAITWNGGNGDGDFSNPANWGGTDPDAGDDGTLEDGDLIFAGAVQTSVVVDIDYSGIDSIVFAGDADTFTIDGDVDGNTEDLGFNDGASIINNSTVAGDMTFGAGLNLIFAGSAASITNNDVDGDSSIIVNSTIDLAGGGSFVLTAGGVGATELNGVISGAGASIEKTGTGTLTLGAANTFTGGVDLDEGTLLLGDAAAMGTGTLRVNGDATIGATGGPLANIANNVSIGFGNDLTIGGAESIEFDGNFGGSGNIIIDTDDVSDVVTLNGSLANLSGNMAFTEGTVIASTSASIVGGGSQVLVDAVDDEFSLQAGAAGLTFAPDFVIQRSGGTAELSLDGSNGFTLSGRISGNGRIEVGVDAGEFITFGSANTFAGGTTIDNAGAGVILGHVDSLGTGDLTLAADGAMQAGTDLGAVGNAIALGANTLTISGANDMELAGVISGTGGVDVNAAGATIELSGTNTYTGQTALSAGTLLLGSDDAIGDGGGGAQLLVNGGTIGVGAGGLDITLDEDLSVAGDFAVADLGGGSLTLSGTVDLGDADRTITLANDERFTLGGVISSTGQDDALITAGTGTLVLSGDNNAWNGGVQLGGGSLGLGHDDALGGGALDVTGDASVFGVGGTRSIANAIDLNTNALTIGGSEDLTLTGAIGSTGGGGDVTYAGSGTVTVGNAGSSYAGTTTLSSGTVLVTSANAFGTSTIDLAGGSLGASGGLVTLSQDVGVSADSTITGGESIIFSGDLSGTGALTIDMDGVAQTVGLAGTNTATGAIEVLGGTLLAGNGDAIADTVMVTLADSADARMAISANETIGGLAGGGAAGGNVSLVGNTLTLAGSGSIQFAYDGVITGTGGLTVTGGSHFLGGANTFTGTTAVSGGLLGGTGSVAGDLAVASGGTLAPGTAATPGGQLSVGGNLDLAAGSTLSIRIGGSGLADVSSVHVTGAATIASGANLDVAISQQAGTYIASGSTYQVLSADGGIGTADFTVNVDSATLNFYNLDELGVDTHTPGDTTLSLIATRASGAYSNPNIIDAGNNRRVGMSLDSLTPVADAAPTGDAADLLAQLQGLNAADLNAALRQLAPVAANVSTSIAVSGVSAYSSVQGSYLAARRGGTEGAFMATGGSLAMGSFGHATAEGLLGGAGAASTDSALAGMLQDEAVATDAGMGAEVAGASTPGEQWSVFAKLYGVMSDQDADGNRVGFDGSFVGVQGGIDRRFGDEWVAGLGVGYLASDVDFEPDGGDLEADTFRIGPYATWSRGDWFVDMSASFGFGSYDQNRLVTIPMMATQTAVGSYDGTDISLLLAGGRDYALEDDWTLTPQVAIQWSTYDFDGYTETGAGVNNTTVSDRSVDSLRSRLAVGLSKEFDLGSGTVVAPEFLIGWEHEFMDFDDVEARFAVGGDAFLLDVGSPVDDGLVVGAGATMIFSPRASGFVRYDGVYGDGSTTHAISGGIEIRF